MAYTVFDATKPDPTVDDGTDGYNNARTNLTALRDAIVMGQMQGFLFSKTDGTGTAEQPQYFLFTKGATIVRGTVTWETTGAKAGNIAQIVWELDTGAGYDAICTQTFTYDGSANLTATTGAGGLVAWFLMYLARIKKAITDLAAHVAATGSSVHGLGTMSTQAASAVAVTGGTINATTLGATTPAAAEFTRATEGLNAYTPGSGAGVTVDWAKGSAVITNNGVNVLTFSNIPTTGKLGTLSLEVSNLNNSTFPAAVTWGSGGKPSLAVKTWVQLWTRDGGTTIHASAIWNA